MQAHKNTAIKRIIPVLVAEGVTYFSGWTMRRIFYASYNYQVAEKFKVATSIVYALIILLRTFLISFLEEFMINQFALINWFVV